MCSKSALNDYVSSTSPLRPTMQQWQERCEHKLDRVDALDEYKDFVAKKGSVPNMLLVWLYAACVEKASCAFVRNSVLHITQFLVPAFDG